MVFKQPTFYGEPFEPETGADKDAALEEAVANALAVAGGIDAADVKVTLEDHTIVLTGMVATPAEIERATVVARAIAGTRPVRNDIEVA
ncbi:BON domain-containing protein [Rhizobium sp. YTU87027]|uniref:BON domain-containing protein n=1 Tax=Rhizobium sp. YTU87027 TaxID=3417741 RepID=UPI003D69BF8A